MYVKRNTKARSCNHGCRGKAVLHNCVCVCARARACGNVPGSGGVWNCVRACRLAYPARDSYAPYCDVICGSCGSTKYVDIIS